MFETDIGNNNERSGSFLYFSVLGYWIREVRLSRKAKNWTSTDAVVESTHRTTGGYRQTIQAELRYTYLFAGSHYYGNIIRECVFNINAADALASGYLEGDKITVFVNPARPDQSYFPSGFGSVEPILTGCLGILSALMLIAMVISIIVDKIK